MRVEQPQQTERRTSSRLLARQKQMEEASSATVLTVDPLTRNKLDSYLFIPPLTSGDIASDSIAVHRPIAGGSARRNDCGVLPSE